MPVIYVLFMVVFTQQRVVYCQERLYVSPNATDLLSGPLQEKSANPWLRALLIERKSLFSYIDYYGLKEIRYFQGVNLFHSTALSEK